MKKHLLALAALTAVSGVALAQNVTVYGAIDSGITSVSKTSTTASSSQTSFLNGGLSPSILGFRGTEDLGGGLKAGFNLEAHLDSATGGQGATWGGLFGRQANLTLGSSAGTLTLGKQFSPAVLAFAATDPRGLKETYSGLITWLYSQKPTFTNGTATGSSSSYGDIFMANAVGGSTTVAGLNIGVAHSIGGQAGDSSKNASTAVGVTTNVNGLTLSAAYQQTNGNATNENVYKNKRSTFGAAYTIGSVTLKANYLTVDSYNSSGVNDATNKTTGVGANYALDAKNTLTVAFYDSENTKVAGNTSKTWIVGNDYSLSKRTTIYALVAGNKGGNAFSSTTATYMGSTLQNASNTAYQLGVNHKF